MAFDLQKEFGISEEVMRLVSEAEKSASGCFARAEEIAWHNQAKVMKAFADNRIGEAHFVPTSGYGYNDMGRDAIDRVYAQAFGCEDALVRHNLISGTHAISTALFGVLRPGDTLVAATGKPYDTLEEVVGIRGEGCDGSLRDFGVQYRQVDLLDGKAIDFDGIRAAIDDTVKAVLLQRSKGYAWRDTFSVAQLNEVIDFVHDIRQDIVCIVDNCYGEFVETEEPRGDLLVGSLIKNPGGGLAQTGGYIAGKTRYVELAAYRLTSVGLGKECGASLGQNKPMLQGFFMAPHIVAQAVKSACLCSAVFDKLGFPVCPGVDDARGDIITSVKFGDADLVIAFCQGIQKGAPVDSFVEPQPWDMPGYADQVIMAAGAFVQGASIELSADAPIRPPYIAYMQGGLTYESAKLGIMTAAQKVLDTMKQK
ncbi:MAG TPA: methionine gamma-lyase family protein [Candidatus Aphodoplasma excrementigallinarum]|uniref:Methionine gamma-lyase family protein n=1 Tax=Candidatus Aphodoplasma excrementigallinarum TaxID=2840673 RepID=A0A9D1NH15_9FIRM|nr:methionine gamma-lyase family protein [Candidatus Aphodoplasma excrementigallinarum]